LCTVIRRGQPFRFVRNTIICDLKIANVLTHPFPSLWRNDYEIEISLTKEKDKEKKMKNRILAIAALVAFASAALVAGAKNPVVGGQEMYPTKNIIQNAVNSADHTTLVAAVKAAGLVDTLQGPGPFTVFAPTNEAFAKLPPGTVDTLLKPENKDTLTKVLTYHVVPGKLSASDLKKKIKEGNGTAELTTVEGGKLWASMSGSKIMLKDEKGGTATVTIPNVFQSNGVIHVIDTVEMLK
jgi:uncharacterized surface protein with fasciclin (FAS1) repeats